MITLQAYYEQIKDDIQKGYLEGYSSPKSLDHLILANQLKGVLCYSEKKQTDVILFIFIVNPVENTQTDLNGFLLANPDMYELDFEYFLKTGQYCFGFFDVISEIGSYSINFLLDEVNSKKPNLLKEENKNNLSIEKREGNVIHIG